MKVILSILLSAIVAGFFWWLFVQIEEVWKEIKENKKFEDEEES